MLSDLHIPKQYYSLPSEDITENIMIPGIIKSNKLDIMTGWFSGGALGELAQGLSYYLQCTKGNIRIITCPQILPRDQEAIELGTKNTTEILEKTFSDYIDDPYEITALENHALKCMAYLIADNRMEIKLAYMRNKESLFHKKINILSNDDETLIITGSTNFTPRGLRKNEENAIVFRSWIKSEIIDIKQMVNEFENVWNRGDSKSYVLCKASEAIERKIIQKYQRNDFEPVGDYDNIISELNNEALLNEIRNIESDFSIPDYINYKSGDYQHQGEAVKAWIDNDYRGILQMCTGAGKTITSLICASLLYNDLGSLFVIISVPKLPLLRQWAKDVESFSGEPLIVEGSRSNKLKLVEKSLKSVQRKLSKIKILISTHDFLCDSDFHDILERIDTNKLLIADECHNLGVKSFIDNKPDMIQYRIGLSATPERQYDSSGTQSYFEYFNNVVYEFNLEDAIGICLVPYFYHVHPVHLNVEEMEEYIELSNRIKKYLWSIDNGESHPALDPLLRKRRLLLEQAEGKVDVFKRVFNENRINEVSHSLVFLSSKQNNQIRTINSYLLNEARLPMHQITSEETSNGTATEYIKQFKEGRLKVLTSMKILDEGLNVPEIQTAYILASTTVEREWTQRRGRVLRKCDEINKDHAVIHDFMVVVPNDKDFMTLINAEKHRIREFAKLSNNPYTENGGFTIIKEFYGDD